MKNKKIEKKYIIGTALLFISVLIITSVIWGNRTFSVKTLSQIVFHLKVPMEGTDNGIYLDWFVSTIPLSLLIIGIITVLIFNLHHLLKKSKEKIFLFIRKNYIKIGILGIVGALIFTINNYNLIQYITNIFEKTDLYEKYYVDPSKVNISFNNEKRNLIHLYLESVENTYSNLKIDNEKTTNYIPELTNLAKENLSFSNSNDLGGSRTIDGTQWTIASQVSQNMGIPLTLPLSSHDYDNNTSFLSGGYSIGEILESHGYVNEFMCGSKADFGGTSNFYKQHGNYIIRDYDSFVENDEIPEDYFVFWGIEDAKLFDLAKKDLTILSKQAKPFNMEIATIDTHTPDGYFCDLCKKEHKNQYANVIECQSRQVNNFIEWCKNQPWYENTTIVITGDHNSMSEKFFTELDDNYIRTPYNCIINSTVASTNNKNREFSTMDLYPTILASMGAKIEGDKLGLGTNLFSDKPTLIEEIGFEKLNAEVQKSSKFYNQRILKLKE
ncbi:MAG: LTA synthase family protein [[Clostridium] spiroforme]|uniref:LTA synthase family protein n=1 Tax=Thomasclavelia spiroformis TaxID=29348 RepID=A0A943I669_9FIRM|nr:LTA synthase family protein [Thomasclavelia spiroformis]MBS5587979.1 LTA synthase family protein [Thomasclavelia spiroformis]